ncbi:phosphate-selective porin O/P [Leptospira meyeri]|uniref:Phosphate-selective porin O/P n=1 Tax=Leptospira meyeri TaxID=29508 RepID=A0A4R8MUR6_LEPME|nr:porin [Leptospira meyeri]EKJ87663.1 hypothetical protein LEP1GSC017_1868 [Leptospira meyeri serovar Hardjo str. Went 5]TDY73113.1 phosphate-selective porin O/P [Leptospira meyeri]
MKTISKAILAILIFVGTVSAEPEAPQTKEMGPAGTTTTEAKEHKKETKEPQAKVYQELYEDTESGQIFTKPGPNRVKVEYNRPLKNGDITTLPDAFAHRPDDTAKEKLTIYGRIQFRGVSGSQDSLFNNGHRDFNTVDWNFRRLRLGAQYENDWWGTNIQLRLENMLNRPDVVQTTSTLNYLDANGRPATTSYVTNTRLKDNRGYIHEAFAYAKIPYGGLRFVFGQLPTQFSREYLQSSANFVTLERSMIVNAIPQFDNGVMIQATPLKEIDHKWERYLQLSLMVSNGKGGGGDYGTGRRQDLTTANRYGAVNTSPIYYARAQVNVFGGLKRESDGKTVNWQEGEEIFQRELKWSVGAGYVQTQNLITPALYVPEYTPGTTSGIQLLTAQGSNPDRGSLDANGNPNFLVQNSVPTLARPKMGLVGHTYDSTFTYKGFYLSGAYTKFGGAASNDLFGYHGTIGYNIPFLDRYYIMPVFKYEYIQGDFNRNGKVDPTDSLRVYWAGLNLFGDKHHFKAQLYYQVLGNQFDVNPSTGNAMPIDDRRVYLQFQANFWTGVVSPEAYSYRPN